MSEKRLYILNENNLRKGDIILTTSKDKISNIIRIATLGPYSHAMLYLGDYSCVDAGGPDIRVAAQNIQRIFFESTNHCCVLRLKKQASGLELDNIITFARRLIGMEYSISEAKLVALRAKFSAKEINRQYCSRYVAQAYDYAGIQIVNNPDYCSPVDIYNSKELVKVENHLRVASSEEIEVFSKESIPLSSQEDADEYIFSNAKKITEADIQTHEQFNLYLLENPQYDSAFSEILIESGFLELWKLEKDENPWFYDYETLRIKFPDSIFLRDLGEKKLETEREIRKRLDITLQFLNQVYSSAKLETLRLQINLYNTLIDLSKTREKVWSLAINTNI